MVGIEQKVAVVTGASQGIGAALVKAYRDRNYRVVATARSIKPSSDANLLVVPGPRRAVLTPYRSGTLKINAVLEKSRAAALWRWGCSFFRPAPRPYRFVRRPVFSARATR
jgi:NAD(P)-dependent dehydrogenase (short-subunit alcohol dehydrogenase family)